MEAIIRALVDAHIITVSEARRYLALSDSKWAGALKKDD